MHSTVYITLNYSSMRSSLCPGRHTHSGDSVVHSYGRLIPHEFPITDLQQLSGPDGIGRINCTVSSGTTQFNTTGGVLETGGVSQTRQGATATLVVNETTGTNFINRKAYCSSPTTNAFYLFLSANGQSIWCNIQNTLHGVLTY